MLIFLIGKIGGVMISAISTAKQFGEHVRERRKSLNMTQRELALAVGVGERFIVELENGKETCQLGKSLRLAKAVGIQLIDDAENAGRGVHGSGGYDLGELS